MISRKNRIARRRLAITAAVFALPLCMVTFRAAAQQQLNNNGTALDANNRLGSQGINTFRPPPTAGVLGNQIVNGNVSNGRGFHGSVPYSDPTEFSGFRAGQSVANFTRDSVGVGVPYSPTSVPNVSTPYYADNRFAAPAVPGRYSITNSGQGYVPAQPIVVLQNDTRLGARLDAVAVQGDLPKPGELVLPGPVDPTSNNRTIFTASSLTGVRPWSSSDVNTLQYLSQFTGMRPDNVLDRMKMSQSDLTRMREELRTSSGVISKGPMNASMPDTAQGTAGQQPGADQQNVLAQPLGAPTNPLLNGGPIDASISSNPLNSGVGSSEGVYDRVLGQPEKQSKTYDELKNRLSRYQELHKDPAQASAQAYTNAKRAPAAQKGAAPAPPLSAPSVKPAANTKLPPLAIKNMADGIAAPGVKDLLGKAESLMKEGKFTSAIDTYAAAEQVVPNQPLIWIGRANAELGAAYYGRAEAHLKQAFNSDKALLMGQYDLRSFLGEERLKSVVKDLQEIARADTKSATPVFLLAYLSYNTGNDSRAAGYLDVADKRSGGKDPIYKLLREYWGLPAGTPVPDVNK